MGKRAEERSAAGKLEDFARLYLVVRDSVRYNEWLAKAMMRCISDEPVKYRPILWSTPEAKKRRGNMKSGRVKGVHVDHAIPVNYIHDHIIRTRGGGQEFFSEIIQIIQTRIVGVYVTAEENKFLTSKGLKAEMPDGCDWKTCDLFARYKACGLDDVQPYP